MSNLHPLSLSLIEPTQVESSSTTNYHQNINQNSILGIIEDLNYLSSEAEADKIAKLTINKAREPKKKLNKKQRKRNQEGLQSNLKNSVSDA